MVKRYLSGFRDNYMDGGFEDCKEDLNGDLVAYKDYQELEAENARLRQQRDAANAQLDFLMEEMKKAP